MIAGGRYTGLNGNHYDWDILLYMGAEMAILLALVMFYGWYTRNGK